MGALFRSAAINALLSPVEGLLPVLLIILSHLVREKRNPFEM
jgi:hypothetical protein